jgi:hypothetical protein
MKYYIIETFISESWDNFSLVVTGWQMENKTLNFKFKTSKRLGKRFVTCEKWVRALNICPICFQYTP